MKLLGSILILAGLIALAGCGAPEPADLIVTGGTIYTMRPDQFYVQAVAVRGDRIVFTGDEESVERYRGPDTQVLDLDGATMLPGLVDAHAHLMNLGRYLSELQLVGTRSAAQIRALVLERQASAQEGVWISGRGWDQNDWEKEVFPTWADLEGTEANPVYLRRVDGHAVWVNRTALDIAGVDENTPDPPGGEIVRDGQARPTGVFIDNAQALVRTKIPEPSREEKKRRLQLAIDECRRFGLTGIHEAGTTRDELELIDELDADAGLGFRLYMMVDADNDSVFAREKVLEGPRMEKDAFVRIGCVKHYADGALGSRGAALLEPYSDRPDHHGLMRNSPGAIAWWTAFAMDHGFQMAVHAIGDAGNRMVIDAYEKEIKARHAKDHRLRIEHAQVLALSDIDRVARLGIIASMQPTHCTSDMYWAQQRLGPDRIQGAYAWRKFIDAGAVIACGSDFPVEGVNPLWGIYAAVTRQDRDGWPDGGWYAEERMSREEAVAGFTVNAAFAEFAEDMKGTIEKGKLADFTVLNRDIFEIPPHELFVTQIEYTIVGGSVVYDRSGEWTRVSRGR